MALIKLKCHYCGAEVCRKRRLVAPACDGCRVQQQQENERARQRRRELMWKDPKYTEMVQAGRKRQFEAHDYADRSKTRRPIRFWTEGEKKHIFESPLSNDELAKQYKVSAGAIKAQRWKMGRRQVVLLAEENKREIERRGGVDL
jgi:hypothetical protein